MARDVLDRISEMSSILGLGALVGILTLLILCWRRIYYVYHLRDARREARERIRSIQDEIRSLRDGDSSIDGGISQALHNIILDRERRLRILSQIEDSPWISFFAFFRTDPCLRLLEELEQHLMDKVQRMTQARLIIMSANNARQTDAALPTTAYMSSPQTNEAGATRQPAESASLATLAISNGHSTTAESMDTYPGDPGVMVTTCPAPSPLPAISTFIDGQVRQSPETWIISLQRGKPESTSHTPREVRGTRHIILSATNARQTDTDLPTITDMWSPQRYEAGVTRQPAESSSRALSNDHSTTAESMDTNPGDPGVMVTTRLAPSPLPAISTFINEQARRWRESRIEASQSHELERTAYTPREVRETRHIIPSANDARQTDADLPTPADMPEDAPPPSPPRSNFIDEQTRQSPKTWIESLQKESALHIPREVRGTRHITPSATNTRQTYAALPTIADMWSPQTHEAGATLQPAESTSHPFYSHHSTAIEPMGTYTGNLRRRFASSSLALENMDVNLQRLEDIINESAWLAENELEPRIGDLYCPREAVLHGIRGLSLYTAFVKVQGGNAYGCKYESCRAYSVRHVEEAIRHQRFHHFNHSPYQCISAARNACRRRFPSQIDLDNHLQNCK